MKLLNICGYEFSIVGNVINYHSSYSEYNYHKKSSDILKNIIKDTYNDYYLERVYKYIINNYENIDHILVNVDSHIRYTDKIFTIIDNCLKHPSEELEYNILNLFNMHNIDWLPYVKKLDDIYEKLLIIYKLINRKIPEKSVYGFKYQFDYFIISFNKYDFDLKIDTFENSKLNKVAIKNFDIIKDLDFENCDINADEIFFQSLKYKSFDDVLNYLYKLVEGI